ncbi:MAG: DHHA1 domain-containing protein [Nitrososphaerales archaeon]
MTAVCISHKEDVDGIVSASMLRHLFDAEPILVDYTNFMPKLEVAAAKQDLKRLFVCDLGLSKASENRFVEILGNLRRRGADVTYIDHHDLSEEVKRNLKDKGINLIHAVEECTSVLIYDRVGRDKLPKRFTLLAACAAIVDDMEDRPLASRLLGMYDKQFVFFEATSLSYAIYGNQQRLDFLNSLVSELDGLMPHEIAGVLESAEGYAHKISTNRAVVEKEAGRKKNLVYVQTADLSTSIVSNMLLASHQDRQVAVAYKEKDNNIVLSIRGSDSCGEHLGRMVNKLSVELGGSGGGHENAAGAMIPKQKLEEFLERVDSML